MLSTPSPALNEKDAPLVTAVTKIDKIKPVGWFLMKRIFDIFESVKSYTSIVCPVR